ncbi:hypothetical protein ASF02_09185 [Pseudomonas sp. Leaf58]|nr:hypothetical protein ASF02_09185 [Pseudomonas sp. Leaf58]
MKNLSGQVEGLLNLRPQDQQGETGSLQAVGLSLAALFGISSFHRKCLIINVFWLEHGHDIESC